MLEAEKFKIHTEQAEDPRESSTSCHELSPMMGWPLGDVSSHLTVANPSPTFP